MSLIAAARTAADTQYQQQIVAMQTRLHVRLSAVLGDAYAEAAEYRVSKESGGQPFIMAVIEGLWFTEFGDTLHVFRPPTGTEKAWEGVKAFHPVAGLAALGPLVDKALRLAADPAHNLRPRWAEILPPLEPREEGPAPDVSEAAE